MKRITKITAAVLMTAISLVMFSCQNSSDNNEEKDKKEKVEETIPNDAMRYWNSSSSATEWSVYGVEDLEKLAEVVNSGNALAGVTITQKKDIVINEKVLSDDFVEPAEGDEPGTPNPNLKNLDSIGKGKDVEKDNPFSGTYDGQGKIISGLYMYQGHQGLGLFGFVEEAVIKNVILVDACVINNNMQYFPDQDTDEHKNDGSDDDRFGGIVGVVGASEDSETPTEIINCFFAGVVGSKVAKDRGSPYEYIGAIVGRLEKTEVDISDCIAYSRIYGSSDSPICGKNKNGQLKTDNVICVDASDYDEEMAADIVAAIKTVQSRVQ